MEILHKQLWEMRRFLMKKKFSKKVNLSVTFPVTAQKVTSKSISQKISDSNVTFTSK